MADIPGSLARILGECFPAIFIAEGKRQPQCFTCINLWVEAVIYCIGNLPGRKRWPVW